MCYNIALIFHALPKLISSKCGDTIAIASLSNRQIASNYGSRSDLQVPVRKDYLRIALMTPDQSAPSPIYQLSSRLLPALRASQSSFMTTPNEIGHESIRPESTSRLLMRGNRFGGTPAIPTERPTSAASMTEQTTRIELITEEPPIGLSITISEQISEQPSTSSVTTSNPSSDLLMTVLPTMVQPTQLPSMYVAETQQPPLDRLLNGNIGEAPTQRPSVRPSDASAAPSRRRQVVTSSPSARKGATITVVQVLLFAIVFKLRYLPKNRNCRFSIHSILYPSFSFTVFVSKHAPTCDIRTDYDALILLLRFYPELLVRRH